MPELRDKEAREADETTNAVRLEHYLESDRFLDHLKQILPEHLDSDRFSTIALRQMNAIPELKLCTLASVAGAIMQAGTLGLEIATQGECWLIPRQEGKGQDRHWEASLQIGYLGHLALAWRSSQVAAIQVDVVIRGDAFDYQRGTSGYLHHKPQKGRTMDPDQIEYAYAIVQTVMGGEVWMVLDKIEIERLRKSGPSGNSPAWKNWYDQMAMGKALKRTLKFCPKSRELARAITLDDSSDANIRQNFEMDLPIALPAETTGHNREAEEVLRRSSEATQKRSQGGEEPPPPGDQDAPEREREPVPAQRADTAPEKHPSKSQTPSGQGRGTLGF